MVSQVRAAEPLTPTQADTTAAPTTPDARDDLDGAWAVGALFAFALIVGAFFTFRFGGRWSESDTATLAVSIRAMVADATLISPSGAFYPNGYVFSAVSTFLIALTGLEVPVLLQALYPLVSASLVLAAWPLYRDMTGSTRGATLATLFLFIQPEFLFVILRGSHERVLRLLVLVSLFLLIRSFRHADRPQLYGANVLLFYLSIYGVIATNSLFGSSYVWALAIALTGSWFGSYLGPALQSVSIVARQRLIYIPISCTLLAFAFNSYIYPPAGFSIAQLPDIADRLSRLFLTTAPQTSQGTQLVQYDPYAAIVDQWINVRVYFLISISTYLLMGGSLIVWARMGLRWLAGGDHRPDLGQWLLWLLYAAFALQGALSIVADRAGSLGGNLQYRSFPSFVLVAAPMLATGLADWRPAPRLRTVAAAVLGLLTSLGIAKASNEPAVSNKWTFYLPAEVTAIRFMNARAGEAYWSDFDERLVMTMLLLFEQSVPSQGWPLTPSLRLFLISDIVRLRSARLERPLPPVGGELRVYDNGVVQVYRTRARTPYQR